MKKYKVIEISNIGEQVTSTVCTQDTWEDAIKAAERYRNLKGISGIINSNSIRIVEVMVVYHENIEFRAKGIKSSAK